MCGAWRWSASCQASAPRQILFDPRSQIFRDRVAVPASSAMKAMVCAILRCSTPLFFPL
jgi:hypothetical protein